MSEGFYLRESEKGVEGSKMSLQDEEVSFAVFILTNGRSDKQLTYDYLRDNGYDGQIYLVVDNLDSHLEQYIQKYDDEVIVFDKKKWASKTDRIQNETELRTVTYARNFTVWLAKEKGIQFFVMMDDDLGPFSIRYEQDGSLKGQEITDMNRVFQEFVEYMNQANIMITGFGGAASYIGGLNGQYSEGITSNVAVIFIMKTDELPDDFSFRGYINEDAVMVFDYTERGHLILAILDVMFNAPQRGTNEGGHAEMYENQESYVPESIIHIPHPDKIKMTSNGGSFNSQLLRKKSVPKILSERWCKA